MSYPSNMWDPNNPYPELGDGGLPDDLPPIIIPDMGGAPLPIGPTSDQTVQAYIRVGQVTSEDLLTGRVGRYSHLDDRLERTTEWVQKYLAENGYVERIIEARLKGEVSFEYQTMAAEIDRLALQFISRDSLAHGDEMTYIIASTIDEILGLGPIEPLMRDRRITEVMVNAPDQVYIEIEGREYFVPGARFRTQEHLLEVCQRIVRPIGRAIDQRNAYVDARLPDGSRVNIVHQSIASNGPILTIRKFPDKTWTMADLLQMQSIDEDMACILAWLVRNRVNILVAGGTGSGKALDVDTLIPTPTGFVRMGDIRDGDLVYDESGNVVTVTKAHDVMLDRPCFEVEFSDGSTIIADAEHLWLTETRQARRSQSRSKQDRQRLPRVSEETLAKLAILKSVARPGDLLTVLSLVTALELPESQASTFYKVARNLKPVTRVHGKAVEKDTSDLKTKRRRQLTEHVAAYDAVEYLTRALSDLSQINNDQRSQMTSASVVTTQEIAETLTVGSGNHRNHSVIVAKPIQGTIKDLPLDPYLLGVWLGDGTTTHGTVSTADPEIVEAFEDTGFTVKKVAEGTYDYRVLGLQTLLRQIGVLGNKHIPAEYMFASYEQRWSLLQGLMDTDGTVSKHGVLSFSSSNPVLRDNVRSLIASLGYKSSYSTKKTKTTTGERGRDNYNVEFTPADAPFRLPRKVQSFKERCRQLETDRSKRRYIVAVRPVDSRPVRCLTVDSPNRLYLAGECMIPTHNTSLLNALSGMIPRDQRTITIEDSRELQLHPESHWVALEAKTAVSTNDGAATVTIRDLVKNSLRMKPVRIVVGEVRGPEALDMLNAMNTGHEGSLSTLHANGPQETVDRLLTMISMGGEMGPQLATKLIASAVDIIVFQEKGVDGIRRVTSVSEVLKPDFGGEEGRVVLSTLWKWVQDGIDDDGFAFGHYEQRADISEGLQITRRLQYTQPVTLDEVYQLSALPGEDMGY